MSDFIRNGLTWKDTSRFSQNAADRTPNSWTLVLGEYPHKLEIHLITNHIRYKGTVVFSCFQLGIDTRELGKKEDLSIEQYADQAVSICRSKVQAWSKLLDL